MHAFCESCVLFHMSYFKLHYAPLRTSHFSLHSSHSTLRTPHFTLHSSCPTLHTALFTLHTYTPPFISSELFSPYPSSSLLISSLLICHLSFHESLPSTTSRTCLRRAPARPVRACFVRSCCSVAVQEHDLRATPVQCNAKQALSSHFTLRSSRPTPTLHTCTSSQLISSELVSSNFMSSHLSAKFFLAIFMSSERGSTFLISPKLVSTHLGSSARQKA